MGWFREQCELVQINQATAAGPSSASSSAAAAPSGQAPALTTEEFMGQFLDTLEGREGEEPDQCALLDLVGESSFEFIAELLERRKQLLDEWAELKRHAEASSNQHADTAASKPRSG